MTDVEFDYLLDAVSSAMGPAPRRSFADAMPSDLQIDMNFGDDFASMMRTLPRAANDNAEAWPLTPFPTGWTASC